MPIRFVGNVDSEKDVLHAFKGAAIRNLDVYPGDIKTPQDLENAVRAFDLMQLVSPQVALEAASDIADVEYLRSGQEFAINGRLSSVSAGIKETAYDNYRRANSDGKAETRWPKDKKLGAFAQFVESGTDINFTLHRERMEGGWTDETPQYINAVSRILTKRGYKAKKISSDDHGANKIITVDPQQTTKPGFIAVRRVRRALEASRVFTDASGNRVTEEIKLNKSSLFALNIEALALDAIAAAQEVRLSVVAHMIDAAPKAVLEWHLDALKNGSGGVEAGNRWTIEGSKIDRERAVYGEAQLCRAFGKIAQYGLTLEQVYNRMRSANSYAQLTAPDSIISLEREIKGRGENGVLVPAATTLWAYRKLTVGSA